MKSFIPSPFTSPALRARGVTGRVTELILSKPVDATPNRKFRLPSPPTSRSATPSPLTSELTHTPANMPLWWATRAYSTLPNAPNTGLKTWMRDAEMTATSMCPSSFQSPAAMHSVSFAWIVMERRPASSSKLSAEARALHARFRPSSKTVYWPHSETRP